MNEIEMKEKLEEAVRGYNYAPKYQVDVMGTKINVPVKYSNTLA